MSNVRTLMLPDSVRDDLGHALGKFSSPYRDFTLFAAAAVGVMGKLLPQDFAGSLLDFRNNPSHEGSLLLRNLPRDLPGDLGPTPPHGRRATTKRTFISEGVSLGIGEQIGRAFGRADEFNGEIVHNISASARFADAASSGSYHVDFGFHTERPAIEHPPDQLLLNCLRGADTAVTYVSSFRKAEEKLPGRYRDLLRQPLFQLLPGETSGGADAGWSVCRPMLGRPGGFAHGQVDFSKCADGTDRFRGVTKQAQAAAESLREALAEGKVGVTLQPGDLLLLQNARLAHARTRYEVDSDASQRRWLQRIYLADPCGGNRVF